jgi:Na+/proline symporter
MPQIFKALASISAWALFIIAWIIGASTAIMGIVNGALYGDEPPSMVFPALFAVSMAYALAGVVVMILRKKMD